MALKELIKNQTIIIDDHKRGSQEVKNWDESSNDIHIDKTTNFRIEGRIQKVRIRIPINSNRPISIENERKQVVKEIPGKLRKEISRALEDRQIRDNFVGELLEVLKDFRTALSNEQRANDILTRISRHFALNWPKDTIKKYVNNILTSYTIVYEDEKGREYFSKLDEAGIEIGRNNGYAKQLKKINRS